MKLVCEIEVPDNADARTRLDAIANASRHEEMWREVRSKDELKKRTDLTDKCGSCKHFVICEKGYAGSKCAGICMARRTNYKYRTTPKCKKYERREDE